MKRPRLTCRVRHGFALLGAKLTEWDAESRAPTDITHPLYDGLTAEQRRRVQRALLWIDARADKSLMPTVAPTGAVNPEPAPCPLFDELTHEQPVPPTGV